MVLNEEALEDHMEVIAPEVQEIAPGVEEVGSEDKAKKVVPEAEAKEIALEIQETT